MPTENDYRLDPRSDARSNVICNYCDREIGDVYTAQQTPTGRTTGRSEEDIDLDAQDVVRKHLPQCPQKDKIKSPADYQSNSPDRSPETEPLPHQRW